MKKKTSYSPAAQKSWNELGIPSDRVAPGAPNPPPALGELVSPKKLSKIKPKMRHKQY